MKLPYAFLLLTLSIISCEKKQENSTKKPENQCFETLGVNYEKPKPKYETPTAESVLKNIPKQIQYREVADFKPFSSDKDFYQPNLQKEKEYFKSKIYLEKFKN